MKPRFLPSLLIFFSAYAPLALIVAAKDFDFKTYAFAHRTPALVVLEIACISVLMLCVVMRALPGQHPVTVTSVKSRAGDLINYSIPYLVAFVTVDKFFELSNFVSFMLFMALMFMLAWKTQSLFINPILAVIGYGLYDVEFEEGPADRPIKREGVFLVKGEFSQSTTVRIMKLSQFLYLATTEPTEGDHHE
jgi:hypothetical protein